MVAKSRFEQKGKPRRSAKYSIVIVCEGTKTEPLYFESLGAQYKCDVFVEGMGQSPRCVVESAIPYKEYILPRGSVWAVFDRDSFDSEEFNNAINRGEANGIRCAWSNEAFELWFLLHFDYRNTAESRDKYSKLLTKKLGEKYAKNQPDILSKMMAAGGSMENAVANAKRLERNWEDADTRYARHNPRTKVFALVEDMLEMGEFWRIGVDR